MSIVCNIAEGAGRHTRKEFINFLHMAQGSLSELDTLFEVSVSLGYIQPKDLEAMDELAERVDKTLSGLIRQQRRQEHQERFDNSLVLRPVSRLTLHASRGDSHVA